MNEPVLEARLDRAERDIEDQRKRAHGLNGDLVLVAGDVRALKIEVKELRDDQQRQATATNERLQTISRWFMFAGTSFLALAGLLVGVLARGG